MNKITVGIAVLIVMSAMITGCAKANEGATYTETPIPTTEASVQPSSEPKNTETPITEKPSAVPYETSPKPTKTPEQTAAPTKAPEQTAAPTKAPEQTAAPTKAPEQTAAPTKAPMPIPTPTPAISASDLANRIKSAMGETKLENISDNLYSEVYNIDSSQFEEVCVIGSMINVRAAEIIVIRASDESGISRARAVLESRKNSLEEQWKNYLPEQYELVKNSSVKTNGMYAALIIGENQNAGAETFKKVLA